MATRFLEVEEQLALLRRGAVDLVSEEDLKRKLERSRKTGRPLAVKAGFDPSAPISTSATPSCCARWATSSGSATASSS